MRRAGRRPPRAPQRGVVAAGHPRTAAAAVEILAAGGNAFDACLAAFLAACVAEPVLASLGGGGFLMARPQGKTPVLYDFFTQTPAHRRQPRELDFHPIVADFGTAQQEFHIGMGSMAVPGAVKGLFRVHRELGRLPMTDLVAPAVALAREGLRLNAFQSYIFDIVGIIFRSTPGALAVYGSRRDPARLVGHRELLRQPELADALEALAREGERLFYRGEMGRRLIRDSTEGGGHLVDADLRDYRVVKRRALRVDYRGSRLYTNPPPSSGGLLVAFALKLLEALPRGALDFGTAAHLEGLIWVMALTNEARIRHHADRPTAHLDAASLLDPGYLRHYRERVLGHPAARRGTTHISVIDAGDNMAAMTVSNGEGCGYVLPGTGIMLNNMLGEEDLNPHGFHRWQPGTRMSSMMAPSLLLLPDGRHVALGSGGSNRIRSALLQVVMNLADSGMDLRGAVHAPRLHLEGERLSVEGGFTPEQEGLLRGLAGQCEVWQGRNLFFGGAHSVLRDTGSGRLSGAGDPRRGGVARVA